MLNAGMLNPVLGYHMPNANRIAEEYPDPLLFSCYPFRHEG